LKFSPLPHHIRSYFYDSCSRTRIGSENYYPEQKAAVEAYVERTAKRSKENVWLMLKLFQCIQEHMLNILLPKSQFRFDWDYVLAGYGTGAVMAVPCGDERDYAFANFKGQSGMPEIKIFF
jgi:leucyl-tRNA synthetase